MIRLRSILRSILCLALALGGRHASAQIIVTGAVQNASLPVWFVPLDGAKNIGNGTVEGTLPIAANLIATNGGMISISNALTAGSYRVTLGRSGKDWFPITVPAFSGWYDWTTLSTNLNALTNHFPLMVGATSGTDGRSGLVPAPSAGDQTKFLGGDGLWRTVSSGGGSGTVTNETLVVAGAGATVTPSTDGPTNIFTVSVSAGGSGSYDRVDAGTGIQVTPSDDGGTNAFAVSVDTSVIATLSHVDLSSTALTNLINSRSTDLTNAVAAKLDTATAASTYALKSFSDSSTTALTNLVNSRSTDLTNAVATKQTGSTTLSNLSSGWNSVSNTTAVNLTNNIGYQVAVLTPSSQLTNYVLSFDNAESVINGTNAIRLTAITGAVSGQRFFSGIKITNYTGSAVSFAYTNAWKPIGTITNSIGANTRARVVIEGSGGEVSIAVAPY